MSQPWIRVFVILALACAIDGAPTSEYTDEVIIKENTPENIQRLANLGKDDLAEELSGQYQGDLIMSTEQLREYESGGKGKTGLINTRFRWPNNIVPYRVMEAHFTAAQVAWIHLGTRRIAENSCLQFVPYDPFLHADYITVQGTGSGCYSSVGRVGGNQIINLQPYEVETGCFRLMTVVHEFYHALGFYHMQSATERDEYVEIVWDKIQSGTENNFNTYGFDRITQFGVEYDYGSMMHYGPTAFSIDGSQTIIAKKDLNGQTMGQRVEISEKDIARLNRMYCENPVETTTNTVPTAETTTRTTTPSPPTTGPGAAVREAVHSFANNLLNNILSGFKK